jgi:uroporphyrinogen decarboxylase
VQGNLDPVTLFADLETLRRGVRSVLLDGAGPGHIFNLGHGVLPGTPEASVKALVGIVREESERLAMQSSRLGH